MKRRGLRVTASYNPGTSVPFVYILRCADGSLYTGYARDPHAREKTHNLGRGARYTAGRRPVTLVYCEPCASVGAALRREREVKRWSRKRKEQLIEPPPAARSQGSKVPGSS